MEEQWDSAKDKPSVLEFIIPYLVVLDYLIIATLQFTFL